MPPAGVRSTKVAQLSVGIDGTGATQGSATVQKALQQMKTAADQLSQSLAQSGNAAKTATTDIAKAGGGISGLADQFLNVKNAIAGVIFGSVVAELESAVKAADSLREHFEALSPTLAGAATNMEFARVISEKLGLNFITVGQSLAKFIGAAQDSGLSAAQIATIFEGVQVSIKAVGGSAAEASDIINVLSTGLTKGTVNARAVQQVFTQIPGSIGLFADSIGVTVSQLQVMVAKGQVTAEQFAKFGEILKTTFSAQAIKNAGDLASETSRLGNAWHELIATVGGSGGVLQTVTGRLTTLLDSISALGGNRLVAIKQQIEGIQKLPFGIGNLQIYQDKLKALQAELAQLQGTAKATSTTLGDTPLPGLSIKGGDKNPALSERQAAAVAQLSESLNDQVATLQKQAAAGNHAAAALASIHAEAQLARVGIKDFATNSDSEIVKLRATLAQIAPAMAAVANSTLIRGLQDQRAALETTVKAGNDAGAAMIVLHARQQLAKQGVDAFTPAVRAQVDALVAATKAAAAYNIKKSIDESVGALNAQTSAGRGAAQALTDYNLKLQIAHAGLDPLSADFQHLVSSLNAAQAAFNANKMLEGMIDVRKQYELQAKDVVHSAEAIADYNLAIKAQSEGIDLVTTGLKAYNEATKLQANDAYIADLKDQYNESKLFSEQLEIETALRKLSANATDEQRAAVIQYVKLTHESSAATKQMEATAKGFATGIASDLENFLLHPAQVGFKGLAQSFAQTIQQMTAQALAAQAIKSLLNALSGVGGSTGGFFALAAGAFAGRASGGPVSPGTNYLVGERGPEIVSFNHPGTVIPHEALRSSDKAAAPAVHVTPQIVVLQDPNAIPTALRGSAGRAAIIDAITSERTSIRSILK